VVEEEFGVLHERFGIFEEEEAAVGVVLLLGEAGLEVGGGEGGGRVGVFFVGEFELEVFADGLDVFVALAGFLRGAHRVHEEDEGAGGGGAVGQGVFGGGLEVVLLVEHVGALHALSEHHGIVEVLMS